MHKAPLLWPSIETPAAEIAGIKNLYAHLTGLQSSVEAWEAGLLLYQTALRPPPFISATVARRWRFIACNECVLELYHLKSRLGKIQSVQLRNCPSLRNLIDIPKLKSARKRLDECFPSIEALRHAAAHKGENEAYPELHAPNGTYALSGFQEPDVFGDYYQGHLHRLSITSQSLQKINEVVAEFFGAFQTASEELEKQGHIG